MLFAPADTMCAPPGSQTQGEVHLTDNPADLDVITAGREHTVQSVSTAEKQTCGNTTGSC